MRPYSCQVLLDFVEPAVELLLDPLLFVLTVFAIAIVVWFDPFDCVAVICGWCCMIPLFTNATTVAPCSSVLETGNITCACDNSV